MEGEVNNFIMVWTIVFISLFYCHTISNFIPKGTTKLLTILPITFLFFLLPLNLTSVNFGGTTSFFIAWLANFKLLLFALGKGPLYSTPPIPLSRFIPLACLPIKLNHRSNIDSKKTRKLPLSLVIKIGLVVALAKIYDFKKYFHANFIILLYCINLYLLLEILLVVSATLARAILHVELEPQSNEPYHSTSLQNFWGRRWNLIVSNILRPTVYDPIRSIFTPVIGRKWAPVPAVFAAFFMSGMVHELIFYNFCRVKTRWEVMWFFVLHGVCVDVEIVIKKWAKGKFKLPAAISGPLTLAFVVTTSIWLFFPPFLRGNADVKICSESLAFIEFVKTGKLVGPNDIPCPFL